MAGVRDWIIWYMAGVQDWITSNIAGMRIGQLAGIKIGSLGNGRYQERKTEFWSERYEAR